MLQIAVNLLRSDNLKRRCVAMCCRHYTNTYNAASLREPLKLQVCPQCVHETPTKIAICHACLAIFICIVRKEYVPPVAQVITEEGDIDEGALQRAQEAAHAEVKAAADTETVAEPEEHDMSDNITCC